MSAETVNRGKDIVIDKGKNLFVGAGITIDEGGDFFI